MTDAEFFASGHGVMMRFISWGPVAFGVRLAIAAAVLLLLPARIIGVHSFPMVGDDRGFWFEPNWSLMFVLVFPSLFGGLVHMIALMRNALALLTSDSLRVILKRGLPATDFEAYVASHISRRARSFAVLCATLAIVLTAVHGATLGQFLLSPQGKPPMLDWTTMFVAGSVRYASNVAFDLIAYAIEAFAIFIGFFFVLKFWMFLSVFSRTIRDDSSEYKFNPLLHDPDRTLGLRPLGAFMNLYLLLVIIFEIYVLGRRLQLIGKAGEFTLSTYLTALVPGTPLLKNLLDPKMYQWPSIDAGLWALLIFLTLPLIVGAYFPLWTLRRYVRKRRDDLWAESARKYEEAEERGDEAEAATLAKRMTQLKGTQLWPNGDALGWRLLLGSILIGIAAWAPPLFVGLLSTATTIEVGKWLVGLRVTLRGGG